MSKRYGTSDVAAELETKKANRPESSSDAGLSSAGDISETEQRAVVKEKTGEENFMQMLIVGSKQCGKTQLVMTYLNQCHFGLEMLSRQYLAGVKCGESTIQTMIWDLDSDETFLNCRKEAYSEADVILLCFDLRNRDSFDEASSRWYREIETQCSKGKPVIIVGLRPKFGLLPANLYHPSQDDLQDLKLRGHLDVEYYREVCNDSQPDVKNLFELAAQVATQKGICEKAKIPRN